MNDPTEKSGMKRWWTLSLIMALAAEVAVCLVLFAPQRHAMGRLAERKRLVEEQLGEAERAAAEFRNLEEQIHQARNVFALEMEFFTNEATRDAIMSAVVRANNSETITLLELAPAAVPGGQEPASDRQGRAGTACDSWKLRCRGDYRNLTLFLSRLEGEGVLLDSRGFSVDATDKTGAELQVFLRALATESVSRALTEADKRSGDPGQERKTTGETKAGKGVEREA